MKLPNILQFLNRKQPNVTLKVNPAKNRTSVKLKYYRVPQVELQMDRLRSAIIAAKSPANPRRLMLYAIYEEILKDAHLLSQIRTATYSVQQSKFSITDEQGNEKPELHNLFEKTWFVDFLKYAIDSEWWGHSLIEFGDLADGEFDVVKLISRYHVRPEFGDVTIDVNDTSGIVYRDNPEKLFVVESGDPYSLGLLEIAAREIIWKIQARNDWATASERFGMPLLAIRTDSSNDAELNEMQNMADNFGANGWVILAKDDEIEIKNERGGADMFKIYLEKAKFCDEQISKLINGQTMTSDNGSSYAQANVHERILDAYTLARLMRIQNMINDNLMPFLAYNGYPVENCKLVFFDTKRWYDDLPESEPVIASDAKQTDESVSLRRMMYGLKKKYKL
jgi:phage gp29-like protein